MFLQRGHWDVICEPRLNLRAPHTQLNVTRRLFEAACCSLIVFLDTEVWLQRGSKEAPRRSAA